MAFTEIRTCCGIEYALGRTGNWVFLTPLPRCAPASSYPLLMTATERTIVRNTYRPDREAQIAAIEAMLTRHFGHDTASPD